MWQMGIEDVTNLLYMKSAFFPTKYPQQEFKGRHRKDTHRYPGAPNHVPSLRFANEVSFSC